MTADAVKNGRAEKNVVSGSFNHNGSQASARIIKTQSNKNDRIKSCGHFGVQDKIPEQGIIAIQPSIK